ncbi:MAG: hypothetical protein KAY37_07415 [Phycisphaerae bacterium]|nr:hypothetical protein [Phycisphaerae bacterium]
MHVRMTPRSIPPIVAVAALLVAGGCVLRVVPAEDDGTSSASAIKIKIVNATSKPLDPQIYVGSPEGGVEGLFVPENKRTNFGVGSLGVMLPQSETSFSVMCGELGLFGTQGGIFGQNLENPDGSGRQVVLQENINVQCGDLVTFAFSAQGNTLVTTYAVTLQGNE